MATAIVQPRLVMVREDGWRRPIRIYSYDGGARVVVVLKVSREEGIVLVNSRVVSEAAWPVAVWWAILAIESGGDDGYHAIYTGDLGARP